VFEAAEAKNFAMLSFRLSQLRSLRECFDFDGIHQAFEEGLRNTFLTIRSILDLAFQRIKRFFKEEMSCNEEDCLECCKLVIELFEIEKLRSQFSLDVVPSSLAELIIDIDIKELILSHLNYCNETVVTAIKSWIDEDSNNIDVKTIANQFEKIKLFANIIEQLHNRDLLESCHEKFLKSVDDVRNSLDMSWKLQVDFIQSCCDDNNFFESLNFLKEARCLLLVDCLRTPEISGIAIVDPVTKSFHDTLSPEGFEKLKTKFITQIRDSCDNLESVICAVFNGLSPVQWSWML